MENELANIGGLLGAGVASFVASWMTLGRKVKKSEDASLALEQRLKGIEKTQDELRADVRALNERTSKHVNDEEFQAYVRSTTEAVNALTEKVGRAAGALEAWQRHQSR